MENTLTGQPASLYVAAWMDSAKTGCPLNAARLRRDALNACSNARALARLRLARCRTRPTVCRADRVAPAARAARARRSRRSRVASSQTRRTSASRPGRPQGVT